MEDTWGIAIGRWIELSNVTMAGGSMISYSNLAYYRLVERVDSVLSNAKSNVRCSSLVHNDVPYEIFYLTDSSATFNIRSKIQLISTVFQDQMLSWQLSSWFRYQVWDSSQLITRIRLTIMLVLPSCTPQEGVYSTCRFMCSYREHSESTPTTPAAVCSNARLPAPCSWAWPSSLPCWFRTSDRYWTWWRRWQTHSQCLSCRRRSTCCYTGKCSVAAHGWVFHTHIRLIYPPKCDENGKEENARHNSCIARAFSRCLICSSELLILDSCVIILMF